MKEKIEKYILLITIIFPIAIFIINKILDINDWHLRSWIWTLTFLIVHIGGYVFSIFSIITMKSKCTKSIVLAIWTFISFVIFFINFAIFSWILKPDEIKEIDGNKYIGVEHISNRMSLEVKYYDTYNWFAYSDKNIIIEDFYESDSDYYDGKMPETRTFYN